MGRGDFGAHDDDGDVGGLVPVGVEAVGGRIEELEGGSAS